MKQFLGIIISIAFLQINVQLYAQNKVATVANKKVFSLEKDREKAEELRKNSLITPKEPIESIIQKFEKGNSDEKLQRLEILSKVNSTKHLLALERAVLSDSSPVVRAECAEVLGFYKTTAAKPTLMKALNDIDQSVRLQSALSLAKIGEKEYSLELFEKEFDKGERKEKLKCNLGFLFIGNEEAIINLQKSLSDPNPYVSVDDAIMLAKLEKYEIAFPILKNYLTNSDKNIRGAAIGGLSYIGDKDAIDLILGMQNDSERHIREKVHFTLKEFGINTDLK